MSSFMDDLSTGIVKREMILFFVIDQSGSMAGKNIGIVNNTIREIIPELKTVGGADVNLKVAVLLFSSGCQWMHTEPVPAENFVWNTIQANGVTDFGAACTELNNKLSRSGFLKSPSGSVAPAIFLMTDGQPTDNYQEAIAKLKNNTWFKYAIKIAVAIEDGADTNVMAEFTGTKEAVVTTRTPEDLRKMIRFVSITSAQIGSKSQPATDGNIHTKQEDMIQQVQEFIQNDSSLTQSNVSTDPNEW
ncbi:MAG: VWA domain-containing protein [Nitrososphaerota archaeon]|jgi:uncharacterized protein YegL|nr:VWA domain-containing protein [Nitrososphaerota archaeon]